MVYVPRPRIAAKDRPRTDRPSARSGVPPASRPVRRRSARCHASIAIVPTGTGHRRWRPLWRTRRRVSSARSGVAPTSPVGRRTTTSRPPRSPRTTTWAIVHVGADSARPSDRLPTVRVRRSRERCDGRIGPRRPVKLGFYYFVGTTSLIMW